MSAEGESSSTATKSPLDEAVRRCGGKMVERNGHSVAAHYGSSASEAAVCLRTVGMTDRSDRLTFSVTGELEAVDDALAALEPLAERTWAARLADDRALARCDAADRGQALAVLEGQSEGVVVTSADCAAIGLIGPRAAHLLEAGEIDVDGDSPIVVLDADSSFELLVDVAEGPELWNRMLKAGGRFQLACVGVEALEHLAASHHLGPRSTDLQGDPLRARLLTFVPKSR